MKCRGITFTKVTKCLQHELISNIRKINICCLQYIANHKSPSQRKDNVIALS